MKRKSQNVIRNLTRQSRRTCIVLALAALSGCATNKNLQPDQAATNGAGGFDLADANHDGKLSRNEASDFLVNEIFDSRDANHDGQLTRQEWTAGDPRRAADFKKRDANGDGVVTKQEAITYGRAHGIVKKIMREADKDHDGKLSRDEVKAYYASREGRPG